MTVTMEISVYDLWDMLWSGARDTLDYLTVNEAQTILDILEEDAACSGRDYTLTEVNDFFAYETDTIAEWLGYDSFEELINTEREV